MTYKYDIWRFSIYIFLLTLPNSSLTFLFIPHEERSISWNNLHTLLNDLEPSTTYSVIKVRCIHVYEATAHGAKPMSSVYSGFFRYRVICCLMRCFIFVCKLYKIINYSLFFPQGVSSEAIFPWSLHERFGAILRKWGFFVKFQVYYLFYFHCGWMCVCVCVCSSRWQIVLENEVKGQVVDKGQWCDEISV